MDNICRVHLPLSIQCWHSVLCTLCALSCNQFFGWYLDFSILKVIKLDLEGLAKVTQLESGSAETCIQVFLPPDPGLSLRTSLLWATCSSRFPASIPPLSAPLLSAPQ